jgi:hypothetical protein
MDGVPDEGATFGIYFAQFYRQDESKVFSSSSHIDPTSPTGH